MSAFVNTTAKKTADYMDKYQEFDFVELDQFISEKRPKNLKPLKGDDAKIAWVEAFVFVMRLPCCMLSFGIQIRSKQVKAARQHMSKTRSCDHVCYMAMCYILKA